MPIISTFYGIKIFIYYDDHNKPHFHAKYGEYKCIISIEDIELINGNMPSKQLKIILAWASIHQTKLQKNWYLASIGESLFPIIPIKQGDYMKKICESFEDIYNLEITSILPLEDYKLLVTYSNDEKIEYSVKKIMKNKLEILKDNSIFKKVFIDEVGNIAWDIDSNIDSNIYWDIE